MTEAPHEPGQVNPRDVGEMLDILRSHDNDAAYVLAAFAQALLHLHRRTGRAEFKSAGDDLVALRAQWSERK